MNFKQTQLHVCISVAVISVVVVITLALSHQSELLDGTSVVYYSYLVDSGKT